MRYSLRMGVVPVPGQELLVRQGKAASTAFVSTMGALLPPIAPMEIRAHKIPVTLTGPVRTQSFPPPVHPRAMLLAASRSRLRTTAAPALALGRRVLQASIAKAAPASPTPVPIRVRVSSAEKTSVAPRLSVARRLSAHALRVTAVKPVRAFRSPASPTMIAPNAWSASTPERVQANACWRMMIVVRAPVVRARAAATTAATVRLSRSATRPENVLMSARIRARVSAGLAGRGQYAAKPSRAGSAEAAKPAKRGCVSIRAALPPVVTFPAVLIIVRARHAVTMVADRLARSERSSAASVCAPRVSRKSVLRLTVARASRPAICSLVTSH